MAWRWCPGMPGPDAESDRPRSRATVVGAPRATRGERAALAESDSSMDGKCAVARLCGHRGEPDAGRRARAHDAQRCRIEVVARSYSRSHCQDSCLFLAGGDPDRHHGRRHRAAQEAGWGSRPRSSVVC
jgi:hypothetical protein